MFHFLQGSSRIKEVPEVSQFNLRFVQLETSVILLSDCGGNLTFTSLK